MTIKKNLLQIVQDVLSVMDSDEVDSISETNEATQIAELVESVYYDIVAQRSVPEHKEFFKLTAASDSTTPTHFSYPANSNSVERVWYDVSDTGDFSYSEVCWMDPLDFIERQDAITSNYDNVSDLAGGTNIRVHNDKHPQYYTSFDDENIVMDGYKSTVDNTLQESKVRAYGVVYPTFDRTTDTFVPDLDAEFFPYLISECKSRALDTYKGGTTQKLEQSARRNKVHIQNNRHRTKRNEKLPNYGR